jgi:thiamine-phosphate pyrophosphorylase
MDQRLLGWARRVRRGKLPPLFLFTDPQRMDVLALAQTLPTGLCGVVFRHDGAPDRALLARRLRAICRARRLVLVIAGDAKLALALQAGLHLRGGARPDLTRLPRHMLRTASAHDAPELRRARDNFANIVFMSPVFPTRSHPGAAALGAHRWRSIARRAAPAKAYALGGIDGASIRRLGGVCAGAGAIDAFLSSQ